MDLPGESIEMNSGQTEEILGFNRTRPTANAKPADFITAREIGRRLKMWPERWCRLARAGKVPKPVSTCAGLQSLWDRQEFERFDRERMLRVDHMTLPEVMEYTGYDADDLRRLMAKHDFPRPVRFGHGRRSWWRRAEVEAWRSRRDELRQRERLAA